MRNKQRRKTENTNKVVDQSVRQTPGLKKNQGAKLNENTLNPHPYTVKNTKKTLCWLNVSERLGCRSSVTMIRTAMITEEAGWERWLGKKQISIVHGKDIGKGYRL